MGNSEDPQEGKGASFDKPDPARPKSPQEDDLPVIDPLRVLEEAPLSRAQLAALLTTCALAALDAYDVLAIAFAAPGITASWGIGKGTLGLVLSSGPIGMAMGSLLIAPLADRWGRRRMAIISLIVLAVGMLMSAFCRTVTELAALRIITGLGIGTMVPIITPMAAEYANKRYRALAVAIMAVGFPLGGALSGFVAAILLRWFDWRAIFLFGGGFALLLMPIVLAWLPEPLATLLERRDARTLQRVNSLLARFRCAPVAVLPPLPQRPAVASYREVFAPNQLGATLRITAVNMLVIMTSYYLVNWMPQLVVEAGYSASHASLLMALKSVSGVCTCILVGLIGTRISITSIAATLALGLSLSTAAFGLIPLTPAVLVLVALLAGAFSHAGIVALYSLIVATFEPRMRSTGSGFVIGMARIAGALSPSIAGGLFALGAGRGVVTIVLALAAALAGLIILFGWRPPPKRQERFDAKYSSS